MACAYFHCGVGYKLLVVDISQWLNTVHQSGSIVLVQICRSIVTGIYGLPATLCNIDFFPLCGSAMKIGM